MTRSNNSIKSPAYSTPRVRVITIAAILGQSNTYKRIHSTRLSASAPIRSLSDGIGLSNETRDQLHGLDRCAGCWWGRWGTNVMIYDWLGTQRWRQICTTVRGENGRSESRMGEARTLEEGGDAIDKSGDLGMIPMASECTPVIFGNVCPEELYALACYLDF